MRKIDLFFLFLWLGALCSCQKDEVATDAMLSVSPARFNLLFYDTVLQITVAANVDYEVVPERKVAWLTELPVIREGENRIHSFRVEANEEGVDRSLNIRFRSKDGELDRSVFVGQTCHNYTYIPADFDDSNWEKEVETIFTDAECSGLRTGISTAQVKTMQNAFLRTIAQSMLDGTYQQQFRVQDYEAWQTLETLNKQMKTWFPYNPLENPTGIYFEANKEVIILVGDTQNEEIKLKVVHDYSLNQRKATEYALKPGINKVTVTEPGLGYIQYYTDNYKDRKPVKVHVAGGKVNGYFDKSKHTAQEWATLLDATVCDYFDMIGERINLAFKVKSLRQYCGDGKALLDNYDEIVDYEQELMGLKKYQKQPKNKMFARTVEVGEGLHADTWGAALAEDCMWDLADPDQTHDGGLWAIAHELGHVNQIVPGLKWVSTAEVTNNVYSICLQYKYHPDEPLLETSQSDDGNGESIPGGCFNHFLTSGVVEGKLWPLQEDAFVKLCPLWQLMLYYRMAPTASWYKPDWYGDVAEIVRNTDETGMSHGQLQLNFMRNVCDVVGEDLTEFFSKVGMLKPINERIDDYGYTWLTITQDECDELKKYASQYPKPISPVVYYLTANSLEAFEKQLPVKGMYGAGVFKVNSLRCKVLSGSWENAVVFETYKGETLTHVAMAGSGSENKEFTSVCYPEGSTRIEAVGWDGCRTLVYGSR